MRTGWAVAALAALVGSTAIAIGPSPADRPASAGGGPPRNVVLIVTDDQSIESLSAMDSVDGRGDWIRFDNAYLNNPLCCPSRASILTGLYSHHTGVETNDHGSRFDDRSTVATWLNTAGYQTGFVGKYLNGYPWGQPFVPPGWDRWNAFTKKGYTDFTLYEVGGGKPPRSRSYSKPSQYSTDLLAKKARNMIGAFAGDPFFVTLAFNAPHAPSTPAPRHVGDFAGTPMPHSPNYDEADVSDKPEWVRDLPRVNRVQMDSKRRKQYEALLAVDDAVASVFDSLEANGVLDDTVVVFMTDNGFAFGAHRWKKKICPYEECAATPFLVRYPGEPGRTENELVSNVDVASTISEIAGVTPPGGRDGASLVPILTNGSAPGWRDGLLLRGVEGNGFDATYWGVVTSRYKYVEYVNGDRELYDLQVDPYELENVVDEPSFAAKRVELANALAALK